MKGPLEHTVNEWALEYGRDDATIRRKLTKAGIKFDAHGNVRGKDILLAFTSSKDEDLKRKIKAEADLLEQEVAREEGITYKWDEVKKLVTEYVVLPITQFLSSLPTTYSVRCNPSDPDHARKELEQLVEDLKKTLRNKLPNPERE